jgi:hypothetical protein
MRKILSCLVLTALCAVPVSAEDAKKANKDDAAKNVFEQFDPQSYKCDQFSKDLPAGSQAAGIALIWAHGYQSAVFGTDEMGALNEAAIGQIAEEYSEHCTNNPGDNFARASKALEKEG